MAVYSLLMVTLALIVPESLAGVLNPETSSNSTSYGVPLVKATDVPEFLQSASVVNFHLPLAPVMFTVRLYMGTYSTVSILSLAVRSAA